MSILGNDLIFTIALFVLVVFSVLGIAWGLFYPRLSKNHSRNRRMENIAMSRVQMVDRRVKVANADRRKDIESNLKQIEESQKQGNKKKTSLKAQLRQAGLTISVGRFWGYSAICGALCFLLALINGVPIFIALGVGIVGLLGLPNMWLRRRRKKRLAKFVAEFPNAVDIIVRGVKTGLPLGDCLAIAASEAAEPVGSEFQRLVSEQAMGLPISKVMPRLHERVPIPETNFFAIVIAIQSQAGGSLSEALGNLSRVLRARAQMKEKIGAMSMEAKASAAIIGVIPFVIGFLTYLTTPEYIMQLFANTLGLIIFGSAIVMMLLGIIVMRNMINLDI